MSTLSAITLHTDTIAIYENGAWQRPSKEAAQRIETVVQACLTSPHWNQIVDGSVPRDEIAQGLFKGRSSARVALWMGQDKIQISLSDKRYAWLDSDRESRNDLFAQHIAPKLREMMTRVQNISIEVTFSLPQQTPSINRDLDLPTPLRLAERQARRASRIRRVSPPSPPHELGLAQYVFQLVGRVFHTLSNPSSPFSEDPSSSE